MFSNEIDSLMGLYQGDVPGASVSVIRDGQVVFSRAYGLANLESRSVATPATNYRLASMTKQFTAAAILLLVEDECLSLDDAIINWLPMLADAAVITIRHLLTHTSGLIDYEDLIPDGTSRQLHDADVLHLLETQIQTYFVPGSRFRYSNSGYALLALIVEKTSQQEFAMFLRKRIFAPLEMQNTLAYEEGISTISNRAFGYSAAEHSWTRTDQSLTSAVLGDGGIYSSIDDLAKWDAALYDSRLLRAESLRLAFTPAICTLDPNVAYAFGWRVTGDAAWHSGETLGFRTVIVRYPLQHFTVIVLTNRSDPEPYSIALAIGKLFSPNADATRASQVIVGPDCGAHPLTIGSQ